MGLRSFTILTAACALTSLAGDCLAEPEFLVRVQREGGSVVRVPLERYVASVVASETYADWPRAALRAQAVVARTYALYERARNAERSADVESTVISQRFGVAEVAESVRLSTLATRGEYLVHGNRPILAAFHAAGGGRTAASEEVWGEALPYLRSVDSPDHEAPDFFWSYEIASVDFFDALRSSGVDTPDGPVEVTRRSESGRVLILRAGQAVLSGRDVRDLLGGRALRSTLFDVRSEAGTLRFLGSGSGHGVGLSQWGARELARRGRTYRQILAHYYPGTSLRKLGETESRRRAAR